MMLTVIFTCPSHMHVTPAGHLESSITFKNFTLMLSDSIVWLTLSWICVSLILGDDSFVSANACGKIITSEIHDITIMDRCRVFTKFDNGMFI